MKKRKPRKPCIGLCFIAKLKKTQKLPKSLDEKPAEKKDYDKEGSGDEVIEEGTREEKVEVN